MVGQINVVGRTSQVRHQDQLEALCDLQLLAAELNHAQVLELRYLLLDETLNIDVNTFWQVLDKYDFACVDGYLELFLEVFIVHSRDCKTLVFIRRLKPRKRLLLRVEGKTVLFGLLHDQSVVSAYFVPRQSVRMPLSDL